jgi:hypothetical protein
MTKSNEVISSRRKKNPVNPRPTKKSPQMTMIHLQAIRANSQVLQLKTPNLRTKIKRKNNNSQLNLRSLEATQTPSLVTIVGQLLIPR